MQTAEIPLGPFLPDAPDYKNPGCVVAKNVIPTTGGYGPFLSASGSGDSLSSQDVKGARFFRDEDGNAVYAGGTASNLFVRQGGTISSTSATDPGTDSFWRFEQFNNLLIAVAPNNSPQYLTDLASDTTWSALGGSPPTARVVGKIGKFLLLGDIASNRSRVQWSAYNDPTATWGTDQNQRSGLFDFPIDKGQITAIVESDAAPLVFQKYAVWRFEDVGGPTVFARSPISERVGCIAPGSAVSRGQFTYFLGADGFYVTNGASVQQLSNQRVSRWFLDEADGVRLETVHGAIDWTNECIIWSFISEGGSGFDRLIIYSYAQDAWSHASVDMDYLTEGTVDGETTDSLETTYATIGDIPAGLTWDNPEWRSRGDVLGAWIDDGSGNSELHTFSGGALRADIETGDYQPQAGRRVFANSVRPIVENVTANTKAALVYRGPGAGAAETTTAYTAVATGDGFAPVRADASFMRAAVRIPADASWSRASAVQVRYRASGRR